MSRAAILALAALALAPSAAGARTASCRLDGSGPTCHVWTGKATFVADGDTLDVDLDGDGSSRLLRVRMNGIQAMEMTRYSSKPSRRRGACHALEATAALERLVKRSKRRVRIAAQDPGSRAGARYRRTLSVRRDGRWVDAATILLEQGHVLWDPGHDEWALNGIHREAAQRGIDAGRNLYDPDFCDGGPGAESALALTVNWDADGNDAANVNGEYVQIFNSGPAPIPIAGWWIRDSFLRRYTFPAGAAVGAGDSLTMHVGRGSSGGRSFYWGLPEPAFENAVPGDPRHLGDGAYLFDPQGDLRAFEVYGG